MDEVESYDQQIGRHYARSFGPPRGRLKASAALLTSIPQPPTIFSYPPSIKNESWAYATAGMSLANDSSPLEIFLLSPVEAQEHVELLSAIVKEHQTKENLELGKTVSFRRPWLSGSTCDCGLITLPYPFGPKLEHAQLSEKHVRVLWLVPITSEERAFATQDGAPALDQKLRAARFDYLDPARASVV